MGRRVVCAAPKGHGLRASKDGCTSGCVIVGKDLKSLRATALESIRKKRGSREGLGAGTSTSYDFCRGVGGDRDTVVKRREGVIAAGVGWAEGSFKNTFDDCVLLTSSTLSN